MKAHLFEGELSAFADKCKHCGQKASHPVHRVVVYDKPVTHIVAGGKSICGFGKGSKPDDWPDPHCYVRVEKIRTENVLQYVTCDQCRKGI